MKKQKMKKVFFYSLVIAVLATTYSSCRKNTGEEPNPPVDPSELIIKGKVTESRTLKAGNDYTLDGIVYVTNGATLTVEPGVTVKASSGKLSALVVTREGKINAAGTATKPIVFTSGSATPKSGDWGGIVLLGKAPTNTSFNNQNGVGEIEGGVNDAEGNGLFGGNDPNHSSGVMQYVRIEYAGYAQYDDKELNSLTMGGVGAGTKIDHIQITYANDDAFEWFGGTVNCSHLIAYKTLDDDFDADLGYSGKVQFGIVMRHPERADKSKVESFETDNDGDGTEKSPQTSAIFSNITSIGPLATPTTAISSYYLAGAQIRRWSTLSIHNSIFMGWPTGILIDDSKGVPTTNNITSGKLQIKNTIVAGCTKPVDYANHKDKPVTWDLAKTTAWFNTVAYGNSILTTVGDVKLAAPFNWSALDFTPQSSSPALTGASFNGLTGFSSVAYKGAVGAGDIWWKGWTVWN